MRGTQQVKNLFLSPHNAGKPFKKLIDAKHFGTKPSHIINTNITCHLIWHAKRLHHSHFFSTWASYMCFYCSNLIGVMHTLMCQSDWCKIHTLMQQSDWSNAYPNVAIWLVRDTYPNVAIWLVQTTCNSVC